MKYLKWIFDKNLEINKVSNCDKWNPSVTDWDERGGFNFTNEECVLRWMSRGNTLCEVEIPKDGEKILTRMYWIKK